MQFYSNVGEHLRTLRVPVPQAGSLSGLAWEGSGLRLALAVDAAVFFASVRHDYLWGYFGSTLAYAFVRPDRPQEHCIVFWDTHSNNRWGLGAICKVEGSTIPGAFSCSVWLFALGRIGWLSEHAAQVCLL